MDLKQLTPTIQVGQETKDGSTRFYAWLRMPHMKRSRFFVSVESEREVFGFAAEFEAGEKARLERRKEDQQAKRQALALKDQEAAKHCHPGQIFVESWGYDQTNIDFYQVIEVKGRTAVLRAIEQETRETGFMSGLTTPRKDHFKGEPFRKRIQAYGEGQPGFTGQAYGYMGPWDGKPKGCSWYA